MEWDAQLLGNRVEAQALPVVGKHWGVERAPPSGLGSETSGHRERPGIAPATVRWAQPTASGIATKRKLVAETIFALDLLALQPAAPRRVDDHEHVSLVRVPGQTKQFARPQGIGMLR